MINTQSNTNFMFNLYGDVVQDLTGFEQFKCQITGLPTPEIAILPATYSKHPLASQMKGQLPGNTLSNDDFITAELIIDENFDSYLFFARWVARQATATRAHAGDMNTFAEIIVLDNNKKPIITFRYNKVFPTRLNQIEMSAQLSDPGVMTVPIVIGYDSFSITDRFGKELIF